MFKATSFRNVSHKATKKSSRAIVKDLLGQWVVQLSERILDHQWSNQIGWF